MIDIKKLKQLREETGVSFTICKKALEEAKNDLVKAREILYKQGAERVTKKLDQATTQGAIFTYVHHNKKISSMVELQCQTDFVAGNAEFQNLGHLLALQVAFANPKDPHDLLEQESIKEPGKKIDNLVKENILKLGENIKVKRIIRWQVGEKN